MSPRPWPTTPRWPWIAPTPAWPGSAWTRSTTGTGSPATCTTTSSSASTPQGLGIQSVRSALPPGPLPDRLGAQVDELDATIRQVRTTIFGLHDDDTEETGLRSRVLAVVASAAVLLAEPPAVTFRGPLDLLVEASMHEDVEAVVREGLSNAGRHARARHVEVSVEAEPSTLAVRVCDDGVGLGEGTRLSGLDNLRVRALRRGGSFALSTPEGGGTHLTWTVPLEDAPPG